MTLGAADLLVHPAQWIACRVVVELGIGPDRFPTGVRVAVLAGDGQGTMRIGYLGLGAADIGARILRWLLRPQADQQWQQRNPNTKEPTSPVHLPLHASIAASPAGMHPGTECALSSANQSSLKQPVMNKLSLLRRRQFAPARTNQVNSLHVNSRIPKGLWSFGLKSWFSTCSPDALCAALILQLAGQWLL